MLSALLARAQRAPTAIYLIVPAAPLGEGRERATNTLQGALAKLRQGGLEADGVVGPVDPFDAVIDVWDPRRYDEIVVSTFPLGASKWLHAGLPQRIERLTGAVVTHVVSQPPVRAVETRPPPVHERHGVLSPLSVLAWGSANGRGGRRT